MVALSYAAAGPRTVLVLGFSVTRSHASLRHSQCFQRRLSADRALSASLVGQLGVRAIVSRVVVVSPYLAAGCRQDRYRFAHFLMWGCLGCMFVRVCLCLFGFWLKLASPIG